MHGTFWRFMFTTFALWMVLQYAVEASGDHIHTRIADRLSRLKAHKDSNNADRDKFSHDCRVCSIIAKVLHRYKGLLLDLYKLTEHSEIGSVAQDILSDLLGYICELIGIPFRHHRLSQLVCSDIVPEFLQNEILPILLKFTEDPSDLCGAIMGHGCGFHSWSDWNVNIPEQKCTTSASHQHNHQSFGKHRILHISDIHIDLNYTEGLNAHCPDPVCCRPPNPEVKGNCPADMQQYNCEYPLWNFLNRPRAAGYWGDYICDVPLWTLNKTFEHLNEIKGQYDWVYWTGDLPGHNVWDQTRMDQLNVFNVITDRMKHYFPPDLNRSVYPSLGNHASSPINSFPPPFISDPQISNQWLLNGYKSDFSHWLHNNTASTIEKGGYYSTQLVPGLKLISLNMNYCNNENFWLLLNSTDPAGQLEWLIGELYASECAGEKVHIIGHIAPGLTNCLEVWSRNYHKIVNRFKDTIVGQFFGHTHNDEFEIFYDIHNASKAISMAYLGPSLTPYLTNNPAYRIYDVDNTTFELLEHHTYILNLSDANQRSRENLTWEYEYNATGAYNLSSLHPQEWSKLVERMRNELIPLHNNTIITENNARLVNKLITYYHRRDTGPVQQIGGFSFLCRMSTAQSYNYTHCPEKTKRDQDKRNYNEMNC